MKKLGKKNYELVETVESYSSACEEAIGCAMTVCKESYSRYNSAHQKLVAVASAELK